ncbi:hypothetical protein KC318_g12377 [Hortaea werneckii]|nr:hypothetical protein KC334_g12525 [Hortaea werneckii]KAI6956221.1 hypothetical protein KC355_g13258 [Hortaea werneckii]KAI7169157.1 hypothetical protein KC324_g11393 [Hortaea werneckii]KAI7580487.1 hypothetical protein KC316_g8934 [Hortaea werneckii]KAI7656478.1 hypothetical protein KC318_g12377 [Hortaea werneckii]
MAPNKRKAEVEHGSRKKAAEEPTTRRITRGMTTDAARRAVFETAELLENVFIQLPPRKIFVIQRVCKQFRDIVATSVKLQQRLFLRSDGTEAQEWRVAAKDNADSPSNFWLRTYRFVKSNYIAGADEDLGVAFKPVRLGHALEVEELKYGDSASFNYPFPYQWMKFRQAQDAILDVRLRNKLYDHMHYEGEIEVSNPDGLKVADLLQAIRCSKFAHLSQDRTETSKCKIGDNVSLQDFTGDPNFLDKMEVDWERTSIRLFGCIAPTEKEWAEMAG